MKIKRGQILKDLRTSKGFNQSRLAELLGVSLTAYQKYEHGTAEPNFDNLSKLADFYGVSTDYLLGRTTVKQTATEQPDPFAGIDITGIEKRIIEKYTALDEDMRAVSIELFKQLSEVFDGTQTAQTTPTIQRHVERLGDIEDKLNQEEQAKAKDAI